AAVLQTVRNYNLRKHCATWQRRRERFRIWQENDVTHLPGHIRDWRALPAPSQAPAFLSKRHPANVFHQVPSLPLQRRSSCNLRTMNAQVWPLLCMSESKIPTMIEKQSINGRDVWVEIQQ